MASAIAIVKSATEAVLGIGEVSIDNFTFKLFYKWSVSFFITGSVATASNQFFGDPIACETVRNNYLSNMGRIILCSVLISLTLSLFFTVFS